MMQTQNFAQIRGVDPEVKKQYDSIKSDQRTQERRDSPINNLRNYSNWVKWVLIDNYCWTGANVLDIGCSRGTDLDKFSKAGISSYVGVDISKPALEAGVRKFNSNEGFKFDCKFVHADFCKSRFARSILSNYADVVSSQVTLQYAFANLDNARTFLHNVSDMLRPGGYFIGSVPDADILVQKLEQSNNNVFGNSKYTIKFDGNKSQVIQCYKQGRQDCYGVRYLATLQGAINDCPEFLVPFVTLERLANEFDLELEMHTNFRDVFDLYSRVPQYKEKLDSWGLYPPSRGGQSHLTDEDWDLIGLYSVFAFRKKVTAGVATKRQLTDQDIVILQTEQHTQQQQQQGQTTQTSRT